MCCGTGLDVGELFGRRKTLLAWKRVWADGGASTGTGQLKPGLNVSTFRTYYRASDPRGYHVYLENPSPPWISLQTLRVVCHRADFIRGNYGEAVFRRLTVRKADWKAAGMVSQ